MYADDPFAARKEVDERQMKAEKKREDVSKSARPQTSGEYAQAPEVKMASALRDMVEDAVKKVILRPSYAIKSYSIYQSIRRTLCIRRETADRPLYSMMKMRPEPFSSSDTSVSSLPKREMP